MPNRYIREKIRTSEKVATLNDREFRLFVMLITAVDDYGRFYGNPRLVRGACFPYEDISVADMASMISGLEAKGMISTYSDSSGKIFLELHQWQPARSRASVSKFPENSKQLDDIDSDSQVSGMENEGSAQDCIRSYTKLIDSPSDGSNPCADVSGLDRQPGSSKESAQDCIPITNTVNGIRYTNTNNEGECKGKPTSPPTLRNAPVPRSKRIRFDSHSAKIIGVTDDDVSKWAGAAPHVDIRAKIRQLEMWLLDNPSRRPKSNYAAFLTRCINRSESESAQGKTKCKRTSYKSNLPKK